MRSRARLGRSDRGRDPPATSTVVEVSVHVAATPERLFPYLIEPARQSSGWGSHAMLETAPGGAYRVRMRDGFEAVGIFRDVEPPHRVVFTLGLGGRGRRARPGRTGPS